MTPVFEVITSKTAVISGVETGPAGVGRRPGGRWLLRERSGVQTVSRRREVLCPTPSKLRYADLEAARAGYEEELAAFKYRHDVARFAYRCACRAWHRTRKPDGTGTVRLG